MPAQAAAQESLHDRELELACEQVSVSVSEPIVVPADAMLHGRPAYELTDSERYRIQAQAMSEAANQAQGRKEAEAYLKLAKAWRRLANEAAELETRSLRSPR